MTVTALPGQSDALIAAEQVKTYFREANDQNIAGALVQTLNCFLVFNQVPAWTWAPALGVLYAITAFRSYLVWQFRRDPDQRSPRSWRLSQGITGGLAGMCWGFSNTAMLSFLPFEPQLLLLVVTGVAASSAAAEGFADPLPPRTFIIASVLPPALWLFTVGDTFHGILGIMLIILIGLTIGQGTKRHRTFVEALKLRFEKEDLAKELERQRDAVSKASQAKSRFLAAASHDLRQPVQALSIFLELLRVEALNIPRALHLVDRAQQAGESLNNLLDSLLDISKLDADVVQVNRQIFSVGQLMAQLQQEFSPLAAQKALTLKIIPSRATVHSDPVLVGRILRNLLTNALRYTQQGKIIVGCRRRQGSLWLEVHDSGIGIPQDQQEAIFGEFYQIGNQERDRKEGLGLGLAIVERISRLLGHPVKLKSQVGRGSCFALELPLCQTPAPAKTLAPAPQAESSLEGRLIAVIENEEAIRTGLENLLTSRGCEVVAADSVQGIIQHLDRCGGQLDAVISDLGLKDAENGIESIHLLRQTYQADLPALLVTGDTSQAALQAAQGADLVLLHKPISPPRLFAALATAIASQN